MIKKIECVIDDIELNNQVSFKSFSLVQLKALNIMMIIDFESGQKELGELILHILAEELESRKQMRSYSELYISVRLNHLRLLLMKKEHINDIMVKTMKLLQYQTDHNLNRRTGHTLAILGSCFANIKDYKNAKKYYEAAICLCRLYDHKEQEKIYEEIVEGISMKE